MAGTIKSEACNDGRKWGRLCVWLLGVVFIASALLKSIDAQSFAVQISYFGIIRIPWAVNALAVMIIGLEATLGMMLLMGIQLRRLTLPCVLGLTALFSLLLIWAWMFTDIKDCGCFGKFLKMTPGVSLLKNVVFIGMGLLGWCECAEGGRGVNGGCIHISGVQALSPLSLKRWMLGRTGQALIPTGVALLMMGIAIYSSHAARTQFKASVSAAQAASGAATGEAVNGGKLAKYSAQWQGKDYPLSQGVRFVGLLSDSCAHCSELVAGLNQYATDQQLPTPVGLILGDEDTYRQFLETFKPQFPTTRIPVLEFFDLIGSAPPRFYLARDGEAVKYWDDQLPPKDAILQAMPQAAVK